MSEQMTPSKKRKWYAQCFRTAWVTEREFKDWLEQDKKDKFSGYCKYCKMTIKNANKSMLSKHKDSIKHMRNFEAAKTGVDIVRFLRKETFANREQIAKSELLFAAYFAEHNFPFANIEHLLKVCKVAFPDSKIADKLSLGRTKLSYVIQDGIAFDEKRLVVEICKKQKFSVIIDESTDVSVTQILAVVVRYFDLNKQDVVDALLDSVVFEAGTAVSLYDAVKSLLNEKNIPFENIIGFGSDNCFSVMGKKSEDSLVKKMSVLDPKLSLNHKISPASIIPLAVQFPLLVPEESFNDLDDQWRSYRLNGENLPIISKKIPQYWYNLRTIKDGLQNSKYGILSEFMTNLTILPHSSTAVKRIFSQMNSMKTKQTNSLKANTVNSRILARQAITRGHNDCTTWTPSKELLTDLQSGAVSQRYLKRIEKQKGAVTVEIAKEDLLAGAYLEYLEPMKEGLENC